MARNDFESVDDAIHYFSSLGGHISRRSISGIPVLGIQLRGCQTSDEDLSHLHSLRLELDVIGLEGTQVTDDGLVHLLAIPRLDNIDLTNTAITDAGLRHLSKITTLEYIHLEGTQVSREGIASLQCALPNCEIVWNGCDE